MPPRFLSARGVCALLFISNIVSWWLYYSSAQAHWECAAHLRKRTPCSQFLERSAASREVVTPSSPFFEPSQEFVPKSGGEVILWESFDQGLLYSDERQYKISRMYGTHNRETQLVTKEARRFLENATGPGERKLIWGGMMADRTSRLKYVLDFHTKYTGNTSWSHERVHLMRTINPPQIDPLYYSGAHTLAVSTHSVAANTNANANTAHPSSTDRAMLTIVMTLKGRHGSLEHLLRRVAGINLAIPRMAIQFVVSVYPNNEQESNALEEVEKVFQKNAGHVPYRLVAGSGDFSRGRGLQTAIEAVPSDPSGLPQLLFICDVDLYFSAEFLQRCAHNAIPGKRVYFPVPFSMYRDKSMRISDETGQWRRYGLGMACVAKADVMHLGGYNKNIRGWGEEDVDLYERFVKKSGLEIMRVIDSGLIHLWHKKTCDPNLSRLQKEHCVWSQMEYEGTKMQLALKLAKCNSSLVS